jgi:hypothetical protein
VREPRREAHRRQMDHFAAARGTLLVNVQLTED